MVLIIHKYLMIFLYYYLLNIIDNKYFDVFSQILAIEVFKNEEMKICNSQIVYYRQN